MDYQRKPAVNNANSVPKVAKKGATEEPKRDAIEEAECFQKGFHGRLHGRIETYSANICRFMIQINFVRSLG